MHVFSGRIPIELGKYFTCILIPVGGESSQLIAISPLASQLNQDVDRITAAAICEQSQLIKIASLAS